MKKHNWIQIQIDKAKIMYWFKSKERRYKASKKVSCTRFLFHFESLSISHEN